MYLGEADLAAKAATGDRGFGEAFSRAGELDNAARLFESLVRNFPDVTFERH